MSVAVFWVASSGDAAKRQIDVNGELDIAGTPTLDGALSHAFSRPSTTVVVDISALTFCDLGGLYALRRAKAAGAVLIGSLHDPVLRLIEVAGRLDQVLSEPDLFASAAQSRAPVSTDPCDR
jgi:anti-anti-sigma factor